MPHPSQMFTWERWISKVVSITDTPQLISSLIATGLAEEGVNPDQVIQVIVHEKVVAGTDRPAVRLGHASDEMNLAYAAGVPADAPGRGLTAYIERVGGADFDGVLLIGLQS